MLLFRARTIRSYVEDNSSVIKYEVLCGVCFALLARVRLTRELLLLLFTDVDSAFSRASEVLSLDRAPIIARTRLLLREASTKFIRQEVI
jgi:hypothetical protein